MVSGEQNKKSSIDLPSENKDTAKSVNDNVSDSKTSELRTPTPSNNGQSTSGDISTTRTNVEVSATDTAQPNPNPEKPIGSDNGTISGEVATDKSNTKDTHLSEDATLAHPDVKTVSEKQQQETKRAETKTKEVKTPSTANIENIYKHSPRRKANQLKTKLPKKSLPVKTKAVSAHDTASISKSSKPSIPNVSNDDSLVSDKSLASNENGSSKLVETAPIDKDKVNVDPPAVAGSGKETNNIKATNIADKGILEKTEAKTVLDTSPKEAANVKTKKISAKLPAKANTDNVYKHSPRKPANQEKSRLQKPTVTSTKKEFAQQQKGSSALLTAGKTPEVGEAEDSSLSKSKEGTVLKTEPELQKDTLAATPRESQQQHDFNALLAADEKPEVEVDAKTPLSKLTEGTVLKAEPKLQKKTAAAEPKELSQKQKDSIARLTAGKKPDVKLDGKNELLKSKEGTGLKPKPDLQKQTVAAAPKVLLQQQNDSIARLTAGKKPDVKIDQTSLSKSKEGTRKETNRPTAKQASPAAGSLATLEPPAVPKNKSDKSNDPLSAGVKGGVKISSGATDNKKSASEPVVDIGPLLRENTGKSKISGASGKFRVSRSPSQAMSNNSPSREPSKDLPVTNAKPESKSSNSDLVVDVSKEKQLDTEPLPSQQETSFVKENRDKDPDSITSSKTVDSLPTVVNTTNKNSADNTKLTEKPSKPKQPVTEVRSEKKKLNDSKPSPLKQNSKTVNSSQEKKPSLNRADQKKGTIAAAAATNQPSPRGNKQLVSNSGKKSLDDKDNTASSKIVPKKPDKDIGKLDAGIKEAEMEDEKKFDNSALKSPAQNSANDDGKPTPTSSNTVDNELSQPKTVLAETVKAEETPPTVAEKDMISSAVDKKSVATEVVHKPAPKKSFFDFIKNIRKPAATSTTPVATTSTAPVAPTSTVPVANGMSSDANDILPQLPSHTTDSANHNEKIQHLTPGNQFSSNLQPAMTSGNTESKQTATEPSISKEITPAHVGSELKSASPIGDPPQLLPAGTIPSNIVDNKPISTTSKEQPVKLKQSTAVIKLENKKPIAGKKSPRRQSPRATVKAGPKLTSELQSQNKVPANNVPPSKAADDKPYKETDSMDTKPKESTPSNSSELNAVVITGSKATEDSKKSPQDAGKADLSSTPAKKIKQQVPVDVNLLSKNIDSKPTSSETTKDSQIITAKSEEQSSISQQPNNLESKNSNASGLSSSKEPSTTGTALADGLPLPANVAAETHTRETLIQSDEVKHEQIKSLPGTTDPINASNEKKQKPAVLEGKSQSVTHKPALMENSEPADDITNTKLKVSSDGAVQKKPIRDIFGKASSTSHAAKSLESNADLPQVAKPVTAVTDDRVSHKRQPESVAVKPVPAKTFPSPRNQNDEQRIIDPALARKKASEESRQKVVEDNQRKEAVLEAKRQIVRLVGVSDVPTHVYVL